MSVALLISKTNRTLRVLYVSLRYTHKLNMTAGYLALGLSKFKLNVDLQSVDYTI